MLFPFLLPKLFQTTGSNPIKKEKVSYSLLFFGLYFLYILINWYILGTPYFGTRGMVYQWFCLWGVLLGTYYLFCTEKQFQLTTSVLIVTCTTGAIYSFLEYFFLVPVSSGWPPDVTGFFNHKNPFALMLMWGIVWSIYTVLQNKKTKIRILLVSALVIQTTALILSNSRGGQLLTILSVATIFIPLYWKHIKNAKKYRYILYCVIFVIALTPILLWSEDNWTRIAQLCINPEFDGPFLTRLHLYSSNFSLFLSKPLFGSGIGNYVISIIPFQSGEALKSISNFHFALNAESDYFEVLTECGILGLFFYLSLIFGALIFGFTRLKKNWNGRDYVLFILLIMMILNAIYDTSLRHLPTAVLFWATVAYFWRDKFKTGFMHNKSKAYFKSGILFLHILLAVFYIRILAGDYFFKKYMGNQIINIPKLTRALNICHFHPDALYSAAIIEAKYNGTSSIRVIADKLDKTSPNYRPTDYLRAIASYNEGQYGTALTLINDQLKTYPYHYSLQELKTYSLAKHNRCEEFQKYRDSLVINFSRPKKDFQNSVTFAYQLKKAGNFRKLVNGEKVKTKCYQYLLKNHLKRSKAFDRRKKLKDLTCQSM